MSQQQLSVEELKHRRAEAERIIALLDQEIRVQQEAEDLKKKIYEQTTVKQKTQEIDDLVKQAYEKIHQAEAIATEYKIPFSFGMGYGMGGEFRSYSAWDDSSETTEEEWRWYSSSEDC